MTGCAHSCHAIELIGERSRANGTQRATPRGQHRVLLTAARQRKPVTVNPKHRRQRPSGSVTHESDSSMSEAGHVGFDKFESA